MSQHVRTLVLFVLTGALVSACGLKEGVEVELAQRGATGQQGVGDTGTGPGSTGFVTPGTSGAVTGPGGFSGRAPGSTSTTGSQGGTAGSGTSGATGTTTGTGGTSGGSQAVGIRKGIDDKNKVIHIAVHGPLTGAGVPQQSFVSGAPKYWRDHKLSNGYTVDVQVVDDKYNAADALRACNAAEKDNFMILGGAGTDQISACAQSPVLRRNHTPYLSSGVTEVGLGNIPTYFASSLSYKEQSPLLIRLAKDKGYLGKKWAIVITGTPNFADARDSMVNQLIANGAKGSSGTFSKDRDVILTDKAPNNCAAESTRLRQGGYEVIYFLGQPSFFALCVQAVGNVPVNPIYTGPGPSFGIGNVITLACAANPQYQGFYLHPAPSWNQRVKYGAPEDLTDDIELGLWGAMQQLHQSFDFMLSKGPLTRQRFNEIAERSSAPGGVLLPVAFTPTDHFGGTGAFANAADCASRTSNTIATYRK